MWEQLNVLAQLQTPYYFAAEPNMIKYGPSTSKMAECTCMKRNLWRRQYAQDEGMLPAYR